LTLKNTKIKYITLFCELTLHVLGHCGSFLGLEVLSRWTARAFGGMLVCAERGLWAVSGVFDFLVILFLKLFLM